MGKDSKIEWCHHTFNPWWGCEKVSEACRFCYAETWAKRCGQDVWGAKAGRRVFGVKHWNEPLRWNKLAGNQRVLSDGQVVRRWGTCETAGEPESLRVQVELADGFDGEMRPEEWEALKPFRARVFCASMADVFEDRPELQVEREKLWGLIEVTKNLDWLLLTKRPQNILKMLPHEWKVKGIPSNVWMGTTVENQAMADERVPWLLEVPATVRFLSCEPLLGPVDLASMNYCANCFGLADPMKQQDGSHWCAGCESEMPGYVLDPCLENYEGVNWVIAGGESGPKARPMNPDWARGLRDQCVGAGVPFLFKQWGEWVRDAEISHEAQMGRVSAVPTQVVSFGDGDPTNFRRMYRVGKLKAGRLLDGVEWNGFPEIEGRGN